MHKNISAFLIFLLAFCTGSVSLFAPTEQVRMMRFAPGTDNKILVLVMADGVVKICDAQAGTVLRKICTTGLQAVALAAVGRIEKEWEGYTVEKVLPVELWNMILSYLPRTDCLLTRLICSGVQAAHDLSRLYQLQRWLPLDGDSEDVCAVAFAPDSKTFAAGSRHGFITIWHWHDDIKTWARAQKIDSGRDAAIHSLAFSPDGQTIAAGCATSSMNRVWVHILAYEPVSGCWSCSQTLLEQGACVYAVTFSQTGQFLAIAVDAAGTASMVNIRRLGEASKHWGSVYSIQHDSIIIDIAFSSDESSISTIDARGTVRVFNNRNDEAHNCLMELSLPAPAGRPRDVRLVPSGFQVVCSRPDGNVSVWRSADNSWVQIKQMHIREVQEHVYDGLSFAADENQLVGWPMSVHHARDIHFFDILNIETGTIAHKLPLRANGRVCAVATSPDGRWFAIGVWGRGILMSSLSPVTFDELLGTNNQPSFNT